MMSRMMRAVGGVVVALVGGACSDTVELEGSLFSVCDAAEETKTACEPNGGANGYSCLGALSGTCTADAASRWEAAWTCVRERCETGVQQAEAESACAAEGKSIPDECGDGVGSWISSDPDAGASTGGTSVGTGGVGGAGGASGAGGAGGVGGTGGTSGRVDAGSTTTSDDGCRSPEELGCTKCCDPAPGGTQCNYKEWTGGADSMTTPWYNASGVMDGACPDDCPRCNPCSARDEMDFAMLGDRPECDCADPIGIDPCFSPIGCDCYCSRRLDILDRCPQLAD